MQDAIAAPPASGEDYWVGMGIDEVVVLGESVEVMMAGVKAWGAAGSAVVIEVMSCELQDTAL